MRILSVLILIHCSGCIISKDSDDELVALSAQRSFPKYRRKLLNNDGRRFYKHSSESCPRLLTRRMTRRNRRSDTSKNSDDKKDKNDIWEDWGKWSICSVTCGKGRQVRWRHCSSEKCPKGLKKAQIKSCQVKSCDDKNLLNWLGIKP